MSPSIIRLIWCQASFHPPAPNAANHQQYCHFAYVSLLCGPVTFKPFLVHDKHVAFPSLSKQRGCPKPLGGGKRVISPSLLACAKLLERFHQITEPRGYTLNKLCLWQLAESPDTCTIVGGWACPFSPRHRSDLGPLIHLGTRTSLSPIAIDCNGVGNPMSPEAQNTLERDLCKTAATHTQWCNISHSAPQKQMTQNSRL